MRFSSGLVSKPRRGQRSRQLGRDLRRFLVRSPMYVTPCPIIEPMQAFGKTGPASRYGGVLIAPLGQFLAPVDLDVPARYSRFLSGAHQFRLAAPHPGFAGRRTAGDDDESPALAQRLLRHRLGHFAAQLGRLTRLAGLELPARIGIAKPPILRRRAGQTIRRTRRRPRRCPCSPRYQGSRIGMLDRAATPASTRSSRHHSASR